MSSQTPAVNRSKVDAELVEALFLTHFKRSFEFDLTESEEILFAACISGDFPKIQELLTNKSYLATAVERKARPFGGMKSMENSNLLSMLYMAIRAGSAPITKLVLETAEKHNVPYKDIIMRHTVFTAIDCGNLDVLKELGCTFPECLNYGEDRVGYPLAQTVGRSRHDRNNGPLWDEQKEIDYVKVLLENGANPNGPGIWESKPGSYLTTAAKFSPLEVTRILIQHGAQVRQSGAIQAAVEANRVEVLEVLLEYGADVNERLESPTRYISVRDLEKLQYHLSVTPLHLAVQAKAYEAAVWLLKNGADKSIKDSRNQSAADLAALSDDAKMVEIFKS
jgi:ankyrin repeat protein